MSKLVRSQSVKGRKLKREASISALRYAPVNTTLQRSAALRPELKHIDANPVNLTITAGSPSSWNLTLCAVGTDEGNRIGRKILPVTVCVKGSIYVSQANSLSNIRVLIVRDWGQQTSIPLWLDVMANGAPESDYLMSNSERFQILYDRYYQGIGSVNQASVQISAKVKLRSKKPTQYVASTSAVTSSGVGQIYMYVCSDNNVSYVGGTAALRSGMDVWQRVSYYDV